MLVSKWKISQKKNHLLKMDEDFQQIQSMTISQIQLHARIARTLRTENISQIQLHVRTEQTLRTISRHDLIIFQNFQNCDLQMARIRTIIRFRLIYIRSHTCKASCTLMYDCLIEYGNVP